MTDEELRELPSVTNRMTHAWIKGYPGDYALTDFEHTHPTQWHNRERVWQAAQRDGCAIVIGAHIGTVAIPLSSVFKYAYAFEPASRNFELLRYNLKHNAIENVITERCAFSDMPGAGDLHLCPDERSVCHSLSAAVARPIGAEKVIIHTLDGLVNPSRIGELDITSCTLLLIDAEGYDMRILNGGRQFLQKQKQFPVIQIEFAPQFWSKCGSTMVDLMNFCNEFGLNVFADIGNNFSPLSIAALDKLYNLWAPTCQAWLDLYLLKRGALNGIFPNG